MSSDDNRPGRATAPYFIIKSGELGLRILVHRIPFVLVKKYAFI